MFMMFTTGNTLLATDTDVLENKLDILLSLLLIAMTCLLLLVFLVQTAKKVRNAFLEELQKRKSVTSASPDKLTPRSSIADLSVPVSNPLFGQAPSPEPQVSP